MRVLSFTQCHHHPWCHQLLWDHPQRPCVCLLSSLSLFFHLLDRHENILVLLCLSNNSTSDIVIINFGMQVYFSFLTFLFSSLHKAKLPHSSHRKLVSLLAMSLPKTSYRKLVHKYDCFHMYTPTKHNLIALFLYSHYHLHSPLQLSSICVNIVTTITQHNANPKFQSLY